MSQGPLLRGQPASRERLVGQDEEGDDGNHESNRALEDEEPSPTTEACGTIHFEDTESDETCESRGKNVARVEDRDSVRPLIFQPGN